MSLMLSRRENETPALNTNVCMNPSSVSKINWGHFKQSSNALMVLLLSMIAAEPVFAAPGPGDVPGAEAGREYAAKQEMDRRKAEKERIVTEIKDYAEERQRANDAKEAEAAGVLIDLMQGSEEISDAEARKVRLKMREAGATEAYGLAHDYAENKIDHERNDDDHWSYETYLERWGRPSTNQ